jgi:hypothetical protein
MRYEDHGNFEIFQGIHQHFFGRKIQLIGRFVGKSGIDGTFCLGAIFSVNEVPDVTNEEIKKRIVDLGAGKAKTLPWTEVRKRNLAKLPLVH